MFVRPRRRPVAAFFLCAIRSAQLHFDVLLFPEISAKTHGIWTDPMKIPPVYLLRTLLVFTLISPAYGNSEKGLAAAQKDDYQTAFSEWKKLAEKGDPNLQATLAVLYHAGQGVKQNYQQAFYWYKKAAEQGHSAAQANLGVLYAKGTGTQQSLVESYAWYSLASQASEGKKVGNQLWGLDKVASMLSPAQLKEAQELLSQYSKKYSAKPAKQ
jgi:hypothetical protein